MKLIEEDLTRSVLGGFYDSYNRLGYGFLEHICVGGLQIELQRRGHKVERECPIAVYYDGVIIGSYRVDLLVDNKLIVEVKSEPVLSGVHVRQLRNYLVCTPYEVGLLLGYGLKPQYKRIIHTVDRKKLQPTGSVAVSVRSVRSVLLPGPNENLRDQRGRPNT